MDTKLSAFVFGGTGSIGSGIVKALAKEPRFEKVTLFGRRTFQLPETSTGSENYLKFEQRTVDFDKMTQLDSKLFQSFQIGFYALGVSSAKVDEATYRKVEHDYILSIANIVKKADCPHFNWVSGRGASKDSWFLFAKVKAQVEEELGELEFPRLSIFRPAMVLNTENRVGICISKCLDRRHLLSIDTDTLGKVIVGNSLRESNKGIEILDMADIVSLEKEFTSA